MATSSPEQPFALLFPKFYAAVKDFPDFQTLPGLDETELANLERRLDITLETELRDFFRQCAAVSLNGLSIKASELGPIVMPSSEGLVIGEFYLHNPGDRLLMLPGDSAIYYLEQRNGSITKLASNLKDFFERTLPRFLY